MKNKNLMYLGVAVAAYLLFFQRKSVAGINGTKTNIKFYSPEDSYRISSPSSSITQDVLQKINYEYLRPSFVGNFGWKISAGKYAEGFLFRLDDFDKSLVKNVKLKAGEIIFRYITYNSAVGGMVLFIKINTMNGKAYFTKPKEEYYDDSIDFENRGTDLEYLNLKSGIIN